MAASPEIWAVTSTQRRIGELLARSDLTRVHGSREEAEQCGVVLGGVPELVRLEEIRPAVYQVVWALSEAASGRLRPLKCRE